MKILLSLLVLSLSISSSGQYNPEKINKKAVELYEQGIVRAQDGNLTSAAGIFLKCIEIDKNYVEAYLSLAGVYGQLKNYRSSIEYYEKAFALDPAYTNDYKLPYSINLAGSGEFQKALKAINELQAASASRTSSTYKAADFRKKTYEFAIDFEKNNPDKNFVFAPANLGDNINTAESEYFPSLTINGKEFVFTRRLNNYNEDFFSSIHTNTGWDKSQALKGEINTPQNEAGQNISQDGQWLVFTANSRPQGFGNFDLYISYLTPEGWSEAVNLGGKINSDQWDSQPSLSPDKRELYFASRRSGGFGGSDIYVSRMQANGKWGEPENLGEGINTAGDDQCPFLHADNQTLYFVSNGLPGYGGNDIYYARKGPVGVWSKPKNMGYPINTISDEGTLFIASDGITAYYASDRSDSKGGHDIYSFQLPASVRPHKTLWVEGQVFDKKTTNGLPSTVELIDLATKEVMSRVQTDETGRYFITLPAGKDYAFNVNRKGYLFYSDNFMMSNRMPDSVYEKNIPLQALESNASIVLNNIFFDVNKFDLQPQSQTELDLLVKLLKENPTLKIEISGHTDNDGKPADNLQLSNNRAKSVISYLIGKDIDPKRLLAKGFGETKPVTDNKTEHGRAMNRRTEMRVISQ